MNERVRIWDIVLIAALVAACFLLWFLPKDRGNAALVYVDNECKAVLDLGKDTSFSLGHGMKVVVENGSVRMIGSTCPDHVCERMGPISAAGEVILCVPNRISVEISGKEVDAVVG